MQVVATVFLIILGKVFNVSSFDLKGYSPLSVEDGY